MPMCSATPFFRVGSVESIFGARTLKSASRFDGAYRTKTAMLNLGNFCWNDRFLSTVINTSKSCSASVRSSPFLIPAHPICGTVLTSCPSKSLANRLSRHSSNRSFTLGHHLYNLVFSFFQEGDYLLFGNGRESL